MSYIGKELIFENIDGDHFMLHMKSDTCVQSFSFDISNSGSFLHIESQVYNTIEKFMILLQQPVQGLKFGLLYIKSEDKDDVVLKIDDCFDKTTRQWKRVFKFCLDLMPMTYESYVFQWTKELSQTLLQMVQHIQKHSTVYNVE